MQLEDLRVTREVRILKAEERIYNINAVAYPDEPWQLMTSVVCDYGTKTLTLKSICKVRGRALFSVQLWRLVYVVECLSRSPTTCRSQSIFSRIARRELIVSRHRRFTHLLKPYIHKINVNEPVSLFVVAERAGGGRLPRSVHALPPPEQQQVQDDERGDPLEGVEREGGDHDVRACAGERRAHLLPSEFIKHLLLRHVVLRRCRRLQLLVVKRSVQLEWTNQSATSYDVQLTPWVRLRNDLPFFVSIRIEVQ